MDIVKYSFLGPLSFFRFSWAKGILALVMPLVILLTLRILAGDSVAFASYYKEEIFTWSVVYWVVSAILNLVIDYDEAGKR